MPTDLFMSFRFFSLVLLLLLASCGKQKVSLAELKKYAVDPTNGLVQTINHNEYFFEVIYRPKDLITEQNAGTGHGSSWDSTAAQLSDYDYFVFKISKNKNELEANFAGNPLAYSQVVNYLNGGIARDIFLIVDDETINAQDALFSPAYGTATFSSILVTFNSALAFRKRDFEIVFEDTQFATGRHVFSFDFASLDAIPELKR